MAYDPSLVEPMSYEELTKIKLQIERRWLSKPHFADGPDEHGLPACHSDDVAQGLL